MPLRPLLPTLAATFALSIFVCVLAAARGSAVTVALAAALFAAEVFFVLLRVNLPLWRAPARAGAELDVAWSNTMLTALVYAWGSVAMFSVYSLGGLSWRHWWQYGAAMALFAAVALLGARRLADGRDLQAQARTLGALLMLSAVQLAAVVVALVFLVGSGKLATAKGDWAANFVFLAGGLVIGAISLISLVTHRRLRAANDAVR
jgi:hypothetical protein